jgi:hypothetical protein
LQTHGLFDSVTLFAEITDLIEIYGFLDLLLMTVYSILIFSSIYHNFHSALNNFASVNPVAHTT